MINTFTLNGIWILISFSICNDTECSLTLENHYGIDDCLSYNTKKIEVRKICGIPQFNLIKILLYYRGLF